MTVDGREKVPASFGEDRVLPDILPEEKSSRLIFDRECKRIRRVSKSMAISRMLRGYGVDGSVDDPLGAGRAGLVSAIRR